MNDMLRMAILHTISDTVDLLVKLRANVPEHEHIFIDDMILRLTTMCTCEPLSVPTTLNSSV